MKTTLIIGSTVVDVIIHIDHLPISQEDIHISSWHMSLGGCAYNASHAMNLFHANYLLCSPIGEGPYGQFIKDEFKKQGLATPILISDQENGFCLCAVESHGERTFISYHGVEYTFNKTWLDHMDLSTVDSVYICGLEIEEKTGDAIIEFLEEHPQFTVYFAPGPRIHHIDPERLSRLFKRHCILHLNKEEALGYTSQQSIEKSAQLLYDLTHAPIIITLGKDGACFFDGQQAITVPGYPSEVKDTIGAGDSHIGSIMACRQQGDTWYEAIHKANRVSSEVVKISGACLSQEQFDTIHF